MKIDVLYRESLAHAGDCAGRIVVWKPHPWVWTGADTSGGRAVATVEAGDALMAELAAGHLKIESGALVPLPEELWPPEPQDEEVE